MSYKRLDGKEFKKIFSEYVIKYFNENVDYVNNLNVFPVPDGDTGTNMNLTLLSAVKKIESLYTNNIGEIIKNLSKGMLLGARGNSGVILSQIWRGISQEIDTLEYVNIEQFAYALKSGSTMAYSSVMRPVEGTILTVMRDMAEVAVKIHSKHVNFKSFLKEILDEGKISLKKTKQILPALREANVVDSGAQGLILIFEGIFLGISGKSIDQIKVSKDNMITNNTISKYNSNENYGYCTEIVIKLEGKNIEKLAQDKDDLIAELNDLGDSLVFVNDDEMLKIHIHTLEPFHIFEKFKEYGEYIVIKAENMKHQVEENNVLENKSFKTAIITVSSGEGINKCFKELGATFIIESNPSFTPSTEDFLNAIAKVNAEEYILMPNDNNILLVAQQVKSLSNKKIFILPTSTMQEGIATCISFKSELTAQENLDNMSISMKNTKSGCISKAVKNILSNGKQISKDDYIGIHEKKIINNSKDMQVVFLNLIKHMYDSNTELITIYEGKEADKKITDKLIQELKEIYKNIEISKIYGGQEIYPYLVSCE